MSEISVPAHLPDWIQNHIRRYLESDGADGQHVGPRWSQTRPDASLDDDRAEIRQTPALAPHLRENRKRLCDRRLQRRSSIPSAWYLNLTAHPEVEVQVEADRFRASARTATEAERSTLWDQMVGIFTPYADYQKRTEREIPVVILEPLGD